VFLRDGDEVYRTYFIDARGDEALGSTWSFLDITPYGRQEEWEDSPEGWPQTPPYTWGGWHDTYDHAARAVVAILFVRNDPERTRAAGMIVSLLRGGKRARGAGAQR
jgi:hypothetical protein